MTDPELPREILDEGMSWVEKVACGPLNERCFAIHGESLAAMVVRRIEVWLPL